MLVPPTAMDAKQLEDSIQKQADVIKAMKSQKKSKEEIQPMVDYLLALKKAFKELDVLKFDRAGLESVLTKRFFISPAFALYGGVAGLYDYGPPGAALQNNILNVWRQHFCLEEDMLEIETTNLTPEAVFQTSGHVERFADYMVKDSVTGDIFRADHLVKQVLSTRLNNDKNLRLGTGEKKKGELLDPAVKTEYENILETLDNYQGDALGELIKKLDIRAPETNNPVTDPKLFNLMFETQIGPSGNFKGYLRPETAQGHFLNFKRLLECNNEQMPFASAAIGKSFRNEISPRQGLLRVREFTMAEIEHYVHPDRKNHARFHEVADLEVPLYSSDSQLAASGHSLMKIGDAVSKKIVDNETLGYFIGRIYLFLLRIGIDKNRLRFRQHFKNEMAHYASDCWDAEIKSSYGWIECVGCADRSAYDLSVHSKKTGEKLVARDTLPEPIVKERLCLEIKKSKFGPAFKKDAKHVLGYFEKFSKDGEYDQEWCERIRQDLSKGPISITGTDGKEYTVTSEMISVEMKKEKINVIEYIPNVIEPSFGIGRILYSLLEHCYYVRKDDEQRTVFAFPPIIAPTKALVVPISNNPEFVPSIQKIVARLRKLGIHSKVDSSSGSIGRRYARNDEIGTPFAITIDFQTLSDNTVTLRERDSTKQIRESIETVTKIVEELCTESKTWKDVEYAYPAFTAQVV